MEPKIKAVTPNPKCPEMGYGQVHNLCIKCMALTHCNKQLFTACKDGVLKCWSVTPQKRLQLVKVLGRVHNSSIFCMHIAQDNETLLTGANDGWINQYQISALEKIKVYENAHKAMVNCIKTTKNSKLAITCSDDHSIKIWNLNKKLLVHSFKRSIPLNSPKYANSPYMGTPFNQGWMRYQTLVIMGDDKSML
jgi:WD40 repeat protein